MIAIRTLKVSAPFSYLWLTHITGVNLEVHCSHCLPGEYAPRIKANLTEVSNITLPDTPYHYLCGVQRNGIYIELENAEEEKFSMADADPNDPHYRSKNYRICRHWQFAYKISKSL